MFGCRGRRDVRRAGASIGSPPGRPRARSLWALIPVLLAAGGVHAGEVTIDFALSNGTQSGAASFIFSDAGPTPTLDIVLTNTMTTNGGPNWMTGAFFNIGGITRTIPLTGIPLPFISFGSSALVATLAAAGLLVSVSRFTVNRSQDGGDAPARQRKDYAVAHSSFSAANDAGESA